MNVEMVFTPHAFRVHVDQASELPKKAPEGSFFYLVTDPAGAKKKYFVAAPRGGKSDIPRIMTGFHRNTAMRFTNLKLAECFADFLNDYQLFPSGAEFWVALEPAGYATGRLPVTAVAGA